MLKLLITKAYLWCQQRLHRGRNAEALLHLREIILIGEHATVQGLHKAAIIHLWSSITNTSKSAHVDGRHYVIERTSTIEALRRLSVMLSHRYQLRDVGVDAHTLHKSVHVSGLKSQRTLGDAHSLHLHLLREIELMLVFMVNLWIVHHLLLLLLDLVKKELIWVTLMILLKVKERSFDAEVGRVLLSQNVQNI